MTDEQKRWTNKIARAKKLQQEWRDEFSVEKARLFFEGKQMPPGHTKNDWVVINKVYSHLVAQLPILYSMDPYFYVKLKRTYSIDPAQTVEFEHKGVIRQNYINYLKGELKLKSKARLAIQDAHFAYGVVKTEYQADLKKNENAGEPVLDENGDPVIGDDGEELVHPDEIPVNKRYVISRLHPDKFLWDEDSGTLEEDWKWCAEIMDMTLADARKDKRFNKKAVGHAIDKAKRLKRKDGKVLDEEEEVIEILKVWDLKNKKWFFYTQDADRLLSDPKPVPLGVENHQYSILRFTLRDKSPYPIPPMSQGIDVQHEYNDARSKHMVHRKKFNRKHEVNVNALVDESEITKLEIGGDGTLIRKQTFEPAVRAIDDAPINPMSFTEIAQLNSDLAELLGSPDSARGISGADSATEADILNERANVKEGDRLSIVTEWLTDIAKKLDMLVQANIDRDEAVKINGPEGEFWATVREQDYEEINGEFEYSVNIGATLPRLPQVERAQWTAFISQVVIPMPAILTRPNFMKKMAEMYGIEDDTMIEELRTLGLQMVQGQLPMPGNQGSQPGVPENNPVASAGGQAGGPLGGIVNQGIVG